MSVVRDTPRAQGSAVPGGIVLIGMETEYFSLAYYIISKKRTEENY